MGAPIYKEEGHTPTAVKEMLDNAQELLNDLKRNCQANSRITRAGATVGFAINKARKDASADLLITTIRSIKTTAKGW